MKLSDHDHGKWESWFAWRPVKVHDGPWTDKRKKDFNPWGPRYQANWYWLCWLERRPSETVWDRASMNANWVYRLVGAEDFSTNGQRG